MVFSCKSRAQVVGRAISRRCPKLGDPRNTNKCTNVVVLSVVVFVLYELFASYTIGNRHFRHKGNLGPVMEVYNLGSRKYRNVLLLALLVLLTLLLLLLQKLRKGMKARS